MTGPVRGMGLIPDEPARVERENHTVPLIKLTGAPQNRPVRFSWRSKLDLIIDQAWTNSCVGCAIGTAVYVCGQAKNRPVLRPSEKLIYDGARQSGGPVAELIDWGCRPIDAIEAAQQHGLVRREAWPLFTNDPELLKLAVTKDGRHVDWINAEPPFDIFHEGADAKLLEYYRADWGPIADLLEQALLIGEIPVYGQFIAEGYSAVTGTNLYDAPLPAPTGQEPTHMQAIIGYDDEAFEVVSSWGTWHGDGGIVRVRKNVIAGPWGFARMCVTSAPKIAA